MTIRRRWAIAGLVLAMAVLAAACSDVSNDDDAGDTGATGATTGATGGGAGQQRRHDQARGERVGGRRGERQRGREPAARPARVHGRARQDRRVRAVPGAGVRRPGRDARGLAVRCTRRTTRTTSRPTPASSTPASSAWSGRSAGSSRRTWSTQNPEPRDVGGPEGQRGHVRDVRDRIVGPAGGRRPGVRVVRPADRRQPGPGLQGGLRGLGGGRADGARRRVLEAGPDPDVLLDAALGAGEVRPDDGRAARRSTPACEDAAANNVGRLRVRVPAGPAVQGVQRRPGDEGARGVRVPVGDELHRTTTRTAIGARDQRRDGPRARPRRPGSTRTRDVWQAWVDAGLAAQG